MDTPHRRRPLTLSPTDGIEPARTAVAENAPTISRLTAVGQVAYQTTDEQPMGVEIRFDREFVSEEQPYIRKVKVGTEWMKLDLGWIGAALETKAGTVSYLAIENRPSFLQVQPTPEQRRAAEGQILEVGAEIPTGLVNLGDPDGSSLLPPVPVLVVRPNECVTFEPVSASGLYLRSRSGTVRAVVTLFPGPPAE